jgi:hypothetical protein
LFNQPQDENDNLFDPDAVAEIPNVPPMGGQRQVKSQVLARLAKDRNYVRQQLQPMGGLSKPHFELPLALMFDRAHGGRLACAGYVFSPESEDPVWMDSNPLWLGGFNNLEAPSQAVRVSRCAAIRARETDQIEVASTAQARFLNVGLASVPFCSVYHVCCGIPSLS